MQPENDITDSQEDKIKQERKEKIKTSLHLWSASAGVTVGMAFLFWLCTGFKGGFAELFSLCKTIFLAFVLPLPLFDILTWLNPDNCAIESHGYAYSCGFYYGGWGIMAFLRWLDMEIPIVVAFIISGLICFIFYLRRR